MADDTISVIVKWSAKEYEIVVSNSGTVLCLKKAIEVQTGVKMARQKLLNLKCKGNHLLVLYEFSLISLLPLPLYLSVICFDNK